MTMKVLKDWKKHPIHSLFQKKVLWNCESRQPRYHNNDQQTKDLGWFDCDYIDCVWY